MITQETEAGATVLAWSSWSGSQVSSVSPEHLSKKHWELFVQLISSNIVYYGLNLRTILDLPGQTTKYQEKRNKYAWIYPFVLQKNMEEIIWLFMTLVIFSAVIRAEKEASYSVNQDKEQHKAGEIFIPNRNEACVMHRQKLIIYCIFY